MVLRTEFTYYVHRYRKRHNAQNFSYSNTEEQTNLREFIFNTEASCMKQRQ